METLLLLILLWSRRGSHSGLFLELDGEETMTWFATRNSGLSQVLTFSESRDWGSHVPFDSLEGWLVTLLFCAEVCHTSLESFSLEGVLGHYTQQIRALGQRCFHLQ